jgi:hypothetical protein
VSSRTDGSPGKSLIDPNIPGLFRERLGISSICHIFERKISPLRPILCPILGAGDAVLRTFR